MVLIGIDPYPCGFPTMSKKVGGWKKVGKLRIDVDLFKWFKHTWDADKDFVQLNHQAENVFPEHLTCHEVLGKAKR